MKQYYIGYIEVNGMEPGNEICNVIRDNYKDARIDAFEYAEKFCAKSGVLMIDFVPTRDHEDEEKRKVF